MFLEIFEGVLQKYKIFDSITCTTFENDYISSLFILQSKKKV